MNAKNMMMNLMLCALLCVAAVGPLFAVDGALFPTDDEAVDESKLPASGGNDLVIIDPIVIGENAASATAGIAGAEPPAAPPAIDALGNSGKVKALRKRLKETRRKLIQLRRRIRQARRKDADKDRLKKLMTDRAQLRRQLHRTRRQLIRNRMRQLRQAIRTLARVPAPTFVNPVRQMFVRIILVPVRGFAAGVLPPWADPWAAEPQENEGELAVPIASDGAQIGPDPADWANPASESAYLADKPEIMIDYERDMLADDPAAMASGSDDLSPAPEILVDYERDMLADDPAAMASGSDDLSPAPEILVDYERDMIADDDPGALLDEWL